MGFIYERMSTTDQHIERQAVSSIAAVSKRREMVQIEGCKVWSLMERPADIFASYFPVTLETRVNYKEDE